jgi:hypothetical protein
VGAIVVPYDRRDGAGEHEAAAAEALPGDGDRRLEGALAIVASGMLVAIAILVASWTLSG